MSSERAVFEEELVRANVFKSGEKGGKKKNLLEGD